VRIAVTGHRGLPDPTSTLVDNALRTWLAGRAGDGLVGLSCLADGADTLFAEAALDLGGSLVVVVPASSYRDDLPVEHHHVYDGLLARAARVIRLDHVESTAESHMDASLRMLAEADELVAVWDAQPARGYGGTADVVTAARRGGLPVTVIWPNGARRA
jgi:hypothetical protein